MNNIEHRRITDVGIDMDGVTYPFYEAFRKYCEDKLGKGHYPDPQTWDFYKTWGLELDQFHRLLEEGAKTHNLFSSEPPMEGVQEAWEILRQTDVRIHVVTARPYTSWGQTAHWLEKHGIVPDHLFFTHDKTIVSHVATGESAMIDDHVDYYLQAEKVGIVSVLRNQPWNAQLINARRAENIKEFATLVQKVNNREIAWLKPSVNKSYKTLLR